MRIPVLGEDSFDVMFVEPECLDVFGCTILADEGTIGDVGVG